MRVCGCASVLAKNRPDTLMRKMNSCVLQFSTYQLMNWRKCRWTPLPFSTNRCGLLYFHWVCDETPCLNSWSNFVTHFLIIILCGNQCNLWEYETTLAERQGTFPTPPPPPHYLPTEEIVNKYNLSSLLHWWEFCVWEQSVFPLLFRVVGFLDNRKSSAK